MAEGTRTPCCCVGLMECGGYHSIKSLDRLGGGGSITWASLTLAKSSCSLNNKASRGRSGPPNSAGRLRRGLARAAAKRRTTRSRLRHLDLQLPLPFRQAARGLIPSSGSSSNWLAPRVIDSLAFPVRGRWRPAWLLIRRLALGCGVASWIPRSLACSAARVSQRQRHDCCLLLQHSEPKPTSTRHSRGAFMPRGPIDPAPATPDSPLHPSPLPPHTGTRQPARTRLDTSSPKCKQPAAAASKRAQQ